LGVYQRVFHLIESVKIYRNVITIILALTGIMLMFYYDYCDTACSYLQGDIWGINLKWIGVAYMAAIIAFVAFRQIAFVRFFLAAGLGVEVFLFSFQVQKGVYCPFCLSFALTIIVAFLVNYEVPSACRENRGNIWLFFLGEVDLHIFSIHKLPLLFVSVLGYFVILFTFSGSVLRLTDKTQPVLSHLWARELMKLYCLWIISVLLVNFYSNCSTLGLFAPDLSEMTGFPSRTERCCS